MKTGFIYIALFLSLAILVWIGRIYMTQNKQQMRYTKDVERTYRVIIALHSLEQLMTDAETSQRGYLLTRVDRFKMPYDLIRTQIDSAFSHLKEIVRDNPNQRVHIHWLEPAISNRLRVLEENIAFRGSDKEFIRRLENGKLIMDKIRLYLNTMEKEEYNLLSYREKEKTRYTDLSLSFLKYGFGLACAIFLGSIAIIIYELRIRVRTQQMLEKSIFELKQSNEEIEQVSFAASHDLQEPLRKIRTMGTLLSKKYDGSFNTEEKDIIERIHSSAERMHNLLANLIDFTNLVNQSDQPQQVDLDIVFNQAFSRLMQDGETALTKSTVLPVIKGFEEQLVLLFTQLLSNSLRYRQPGRKLSIQVSYHLSVPTPKYFFWIKDKVKQYHVITISDNGIGFDKSMNEKIFVLFQRLHTKEEYPGQGTGLTIARRIMVNHYGYIEADGRKGEGASFMLFFPA